MSDLLLAKLKEYENLPGNVLGLDGWVLRSLPRDQRKFFLEAYLKAMRVAFHPDRSPNEEGRKARESFVKALVEAVTFLCSGTLEYEMATDLVPARKNFMVQLKQDVLQRDAALTAQDDRVTEVERSNENLRIENQKLVSERRWLTKTMHDEGYRFMRLLRELGARMTLAPYPLTLSVIVKGRWLDWDKLMAHPEFVARADSWGDYQLTHEGTSNRIAALSDVLKPVEELKIHGKDIRLEDVKNSHLHDDGSVEAECVHALKVRGSVSFGGMDCVRKVPGKHGDKPSPAEVSQAWHTRSRWEAVMYPFTQSGLFLCCERNGADCSEDAPTAMHLFWVKEVRRVDGVSKNLRHNDRYEHVQRLVRGQEQEMKDVLDKIRVAQEKRRKRKEGLAALYRERERTDTEEAIMGLLKTVRTASRAKILTRLEQLGRQILAQVEADAKAKRDAKDKRQTHD